MRKRTRPLALLATVPVVALAALAALGRPAAARAQQAEPWAPDSVTAADYARAESFLRSSTDSLVTGVASSPEWLADGRFWYRTRTARGFEFTLVDPARRKKGPAFDQQKLAAALSAAADTTYDAWHLPFRSFEYAAAGDSITFTADAHHYRCDTAGTSCTNEGRAPRGGVRNVVLSPDGKLGAFLRDWNLWVRNLETGKETRLTTDGVEDYGYATNNAGWIRSDRPVILWSPDSRRIATFRQDQRNVGEMYLVHTRVGHPELDAWKYPLPGDSVVTMIERVVVDPGGPDGPKVVKLDMPPDQHRSGVCDHVACRGGGPGGDFADVEWSPDGSRLFFVSTSRDHRHETLREADPETGEVRDILSESAGDFLETGYNTSDWHVIPSKNRIVWYSQRDDHGHLYLYDLRTGKLERRITGGPWNVLQVRKIDRSTGTIWFTGAGREPGDPYLRRAYSVRTDGSHLRLLTPDSADHQVSFSPDGRWFVDRASTPQTPPVTVLRDARGRKAMELERADISRLVAAGWKPPASITVKARDGKTEVYGLLFTPTDLDSTKAYPVVNHIYPGPQTGSVGSRSFEASRGDAQALAELGFVVVEIDALGTPMRSHSFQAAWYGDMGDNGLPDQVAGMRELAARYPWIDLSRAGIYGHSGGGFATADAMFRYPDFFKVGIAEAGNHDNRDYEDDWGEKWQGLLTTGPDGKTSYDNQANELVARKLKGKLLLAYGTTDDNVPPYNTLLVVDSLIAANKDFDLIALPNRRHGFGAEPYMVRRRWDYFVRNLLGAEPPHEFAIGEDRGEE